jgi:hypothetical protein
MSPPACAVGRVGVGGPWVGFAPTLEDGYALVVGVDDRSARSAADTDDLLALAITYFEDTLAGPPEELAATHGDIGALVRHVAELEADQARRRELREAVDAIDDGLAADVVVGRLVRCLGTAEEPAARLRRRAVQLLAESGG